MSSDQENPWLVRGPLWVIAVSLLTIAGCLVLLLIRTFLPQQTPGTTAEAQAQNANSSRKPDRPSVEQAGGIKVTRTAPVREPDLSKSAWPAMPDGLSPPQQEAMPAPRFAAAVRPVAPSTLPAAIYNGQINYGTAIHGTVRLRGSAPPETTFDPAGSCSAEAGQTLSTRFFVIDPKGGLADTLVFLSSFSSKPFLLLPSVTNQMVFTNCQLEPYINVWTFNQAVSVTETSGLGHTLRIKNTYGQTREVRDISAGENLSLDFKLTPDYMTMTCDLHPWELSFAAVLVHPFFAITDSHGEFTITNVPPGKYTVEAMHRDGSSRRISSSTEVVVRQQKTALVDFILNAPSK